MSNSELDLIILLLDSVKGRKIVGRLRFHKLLFLLLKEGNLSSFRDQFDFEPYLYGPWSPKVDASFQNLEDMALISIHSETVSVFDSCEEQFASGNGRRSSQAYVLDDRGRQIAEKLRDVHSKKMDRINSVITTFSKRSNSDLLNYIYSSYPSFSENSQIKDSVKQLSPSEEFEMAYPNEEIDDDLFSIVGIISRIPLERDKEKIREAMIGRF